MLKFTTKSLFNDLYLNNGDFFIIQIQINYNSSKTSYNY